MHYKLYINVVINTNIFISQAYINILLKVDPRVSPCPLRMDNRRNNYGRTWVGNRIYKHTTTARTRIIGRTKYVPDRPVVKVNLFGDTPTTSRRLSYNIAGSCVVVAGGVR